MLSVYVPRGTSLERIPVEPGQSPSPAAVWIDLVSPTLQEDKVVEAVLGIAVPTREEMQEIEVSSRLYRERRALHDRDADVSVGYGDAENHAGHLHPVE